MVEDKVNNSVNMVEEKKPIYKRTEGIIGIILVGLCCLGIIAFVGIGMLIPDNTTTNDTPTKDTPTIPSGDLTYQEKVDTILSKYDNNNDKRIDTTEFGYWSVDAGMNNDEIKAFASVFVNYDLDSNEYLDEEELNNFFAKNSN